MQQYSVIRLQHPDALLLFQVGDFYELFFDDAKKAAAFLGIALTARGKNNGEPIPLCGVPLRALDHYLTKLVKGGFKVAICDQLEEPKPGAIVKRGVTRVLTPGTLTDSQLLDAKSASYLFSFFPGPDLWGLIFGELLTAQLFGTVIPAVAMRAVESELIRFFPDEIILPSGDQAKPFQAHFKKLGYFTSVVEVDIHDGVQQDQLAQWLKQFDNRTRSSIEQRTALRSALHIFYAFLRTTHQGALSQFSHLQLYQPDDFMMLDSATQRNLELVKNNRDGKQNNTLFWVLDGAVTSMGSRMIKKWLLRPLINIDAIVRRQNVVELFKKDIAAAQQLATMLKRIGDIERVIGRIALHRAQVNDYIALAYALEQLPELKSLIAQYAQYALLTVVAGHVASFSSLCQLLAASINNDATKPWIIKQGFNKKLDEIRELAQSGYQKILELQKREIDVTGISSLKVRFNQVYGYYIEITKPNLHLVPERYTRRQTLANRERFTTQELQNLQQEIERAKARVSLLEKDLFDDVKRRVYEQITMLRKLAHALAHLDALLGLSRVAYDHEYVRPSFNEQRDISIKKGVHPVVQRILENHFIPNDTELTDEQSLWVITGPNMGGKSTYLRQVALTCIMAQTGSFVSAQSASLPLLDRIFTRIGAGDNLAQGKSTFLVEMEETAAICTQATKKSLVILDEIGRGTSTFDGLALAQAVIEYIYQTVQARCLFATHYHELTVLKDRFSGIESYFAASTKTGTGITFLYKITKGVADGSFGIEVAKLAHLPTSVIQRAQELLIELTANQQYSMGRTNSEHADGQLALLAQKNTALKQHITRLQQRLALATSYKKTLAEVDYDDLSPKKAFDLLWRLKESDECV